MAFKVVKLSSIEDNPHRDSKAYVYNETKILSLMESIGDTSFWENLLARQTKEGVIQLAYGHHRKQALLKLVAEGLTQYEEIKINVRPERELTDEMMLKIFAQENKDEWGEDPRNLCMTVLQIRAHLQTLLDASGSKDDLMKKVGAAGALKMDDRSFTRMKNAGVGASTIAQFLGDTWSRQTIQDAMALIDSDPEVFELAKNLPNVTLANRFQKLITKDKKAGEMFDDKTQQKVASMILDNSLSRAEVETALSITKDQGEKDPIAALKTVVDKKKANLKEIRDKAAADRPTPKEPLEKVLTTMERVLDVVTKERVNLKAKDIKKIKKGWGLIEEVLDTEPEEIKPAVVED